MKLKFVWLPLLLSINTAWAIDGPPRAPVPGAAHAPRAFAPPAATPRWHRQLPRHSAAAEAGALVREGVEGLLAFLGQKPRPSELKLAAYLDENVASRFDFAFMARAAMGRAFNRLSAEKKVDLVQKIEQDFLETLTERLASYKDQQVRFFRPRKGRSGRASVTVGIKNPGGYPARLDFRLHKGTDGWKIYDVVGNGSSAVSHYRRKFAQAIRTARAQRPQRPVPYRSYR